nr:MAG TPA: hypothetical protein [Caudoviricetes sp.]DAL75612.1 MAG TPA: hypothetical protein [Caudoviricetes sp.]
MMAKIFPPILDCTFTVQSFLYIKKPLDYGI